jgi:hypothetical protein
MGFPAGSRLMQLFENQMDSTASQGFLRFVAAKRMRFAQPSMQELD